VSAVCVAHLVRRGNPLSALQQFLDSYRSHPAGAAHDLLIIFKGFGSPSSVAPCEPLLAGVKHRRMFVRDFGFDVRPYLKAGREQPHDLFVFLNSFSRILVPGWLEHLLRHVRRPGVGLVGATGSHQSPLSDSAVLRREKKKLLRLGRYAVSIRGRFAPFPNPHVRTNAFIVSKRVLERVRCFPALTKWSAYRFESGIHSLTRQVIAAGLMPLVAGRNGDAYQPPDWPQAGTFWIGGQENLLVSDNQTRAYELGGQAFRERLAYFAWRRYPDGRARQDVPTPADDR
jgi:hypothetical protein